MLVGLSSSKHTSLARWTSTSEQSFPDKMAVSWGWWNSLQLDRMGCRSPKHNLRAWHRLDSLYVQGLGQAKPLLYHPAILACVSSHSRHSSAHQLWQGTCNLLGCKTVGKHCQSDPDVQNNFLHFWVPSKPQQQRFCRSRQLEGQPCHGVHRPLLLLGSLAPSRPVPLHWYSAVLWEDLLLREERPLPPRSTRAVQRPAQSWEMVLHGGVDLHMMWDACRHRLSTVAASLAPAGNTNPWCGWRHDILRQPYANHKAETPQYCVLSGWEEGNRGRWDHGEQMVLSRSSVLHTKCERTLLVSCWHPCIHRWHERLEHLQGLPINYCCHQSSNCYLPMTS